MLKKIPTSSAVENLKQTKTGARSLPFTRLESFPGSDRVRRRLNLARISIPTSPHEKVACLRTARTNEGVIDVGVAIPTGCTRLALSRPMLSVSPQQPMIGWYPSESGGLVARSGGMWPLAGGVAKTRFYRHSPSRQGRRRGKECGRERASKSRRIAPQGSPDLRAPHASVPL